MGREGVKRNFFLALLPFLSKKLLKKLGVFLIFFMGQGRGSLGKNIFFSIRGSIFALGRGTRF